MSNGDDNGGSKSLHEKIGYMRSDIRNLKEGLTNQSKHIAGKVDKIFGKIDEVKTEVVELKGSTVTHTECADRVTRITAELGKISTKLDTQVPPPIVGNTPSGQFLIPEELYEPEEEKPKKLDLVSKLKNNLSLFVVILTTLGILGTFMYKFSHVVVRAENALKVTEKISNRLNAVLDAGTKSGGRNSNP